MIYDLCTCFVGLILFAGLNSSEQEYTFKVI